MTIEFAVSNAGAKSLTVPVIVSTKTAGQPTGVAKRPAGVLLAIDTERIIGHEELMTMFDALRTAVLDPSANPLTEVST